MRAVGSGKIGGNCHLGKWGEIALGGAAEVTVTGLPEFSGEQIEGKCGDKLRAPAAGVCPQRWNQ